MTKTKTTYEWDVERFDPLSDDIEEHAFCDTYAEAMQAAIDEPLPVGQLCRIVLVRGVNDAVSGDLVDRQWAYVEENIATPWSLPEEFDNGVGPGGVMVPKRFHAEVARAEENRGDTARIMETAVKIARAFWAGGQEIEDAAHRAVVLHPGLYSDPAEQYEAREHIEDRLRNGRDK